MVSGGRAGVEMAAVRPRLPRLDDLHVALSPSTCEHLKPRCRAPGAAGEGAEGGAGGAEQLATLKVTSTG